MTSSPHLRKPGPEHVRRAWGTIDENELRVPPAVAEQVVDALNADLSGLYILFNQVRKHAWLLEGAESNDLRAFLRATADRLTETTDDLAIRVHALGGVPVCGPMGVRQHASLFIEPANLYDMRSSLERDLDGFATLAVQLRDHIELVQELGDNATLELLQGHLKTLEGDAHTLDRYLADDTLVRRGADE